MARKRTRLIGWTYDDERQEIRTQGGRVIPLIEVAQRLQDDVNCRFDFGGAWLGWRMRGDRLYPPGHKRGNGSITPWCWPAFVAYLDDMSRRDLAAAGIPLARTPLRLVTVNGCLIPSRSHRHTEPIGQTDKADQLP